MFFRYLNHEGATTDMFDRDGYYKTGDIAHRVGEYYIFDGRASMDCKSLEYKRILLRTQLIVSFSHQSHRRSSANSSGGTSIEQPTLGCACCSRPRRRRGCRQKSGRHWSFPEPCYPPQFETRSLAALASENVAYGLPSAFRQRKASNDVQ